MRRRNRTAGADRVLTVSLNLRAWPCPLFSQPTLGETTPTFEDKGQSVGTVFD